MKVVVGASSFASQSKNALNLLLERGYEVILNPIGRKLNLEETIAHLQGADGLLAGLETLNEQVFSACPQLKAIARIGIGMDNVDIKAAQNRCIKVSNTPDGPTYAVAEMTLAALLSIARQIIPANEDIHNGIWKKRMGISLQGSSVLLIGYGRIAKYFASLLEPFKVNLIIYDPALPEQSAGSLEELLPKADVVSLHASGKEVILGKTHFALLNKGTIILNSARGSLVDESALLSALSDGTVSWYWADSFPQEPYNGPLSNCNNAILTPHIATYTNLCREQMETQAVKNLLEDLE